MNKLKLQKYWFKDNLNLSDKGAYLGDFADRDTFNELILAWCNMGFELEIGLALTQSCETHHALYCKNYEDMIKIFGSLVPDLEYAKIDEKLEEYLNKLD